MIASRRLRRTKGSKAITHVIGRLAHPEQRKAPEKGEGSSVGVLCDADRGDRGTAFCGPSRLLLGVFMAGMGDSVSRTFYHQPFRSAVRPNAGSGRFDRFDIEL